MSVYSMTGYASLQTPPSGASDGAATPRSALRLGLELRSVNSRFLDLSFKLGDELRAHEAALRELLTQRLKRGKVELRAYLVADSHSALGFQHINPAALQQLARAQEQVMAWLPTARPLSVADALRLGASQSPSSPSQSPDSDLSEPLLALATQALQAFIASREREGARLAAMLRERVAQLRKLVQTAQPLVPQLVITQQQRFVERFNEALKQADGGAPSTGSVSSATAQERALTEAAAFAIRIDVAEELTRLVAHLDEIDALLGGTSAKSTAKATDKASELGKRLDFIIQELHREANTLGSKSSTLELSRISVDMKVLIEQMREQVQNIE
jgi:uncharacterized protein (TIGR00255 family)